MNTQLFSLVAMAGIATIILSSSTSAQSVVPLSNPSFVQASQAEMQALRAVSDAPTADATLTAAEEFLKKYPKSSARQKVLETVAIAIAQVKDPTQAVTLGEKAQPLFVTPQQQDILKPIMVEIYAAANRPDDAFRLAGEMLAKDPEDLRILIQMTLTGTEQARLKNMKYAAQTLQYGLKAIELIEANKKPPTMSEELWANYRAALPRLYQQTAILNLVAGNSQEAKDRLVKTTTLNPNDPYPLALLGFVLNDEYAKLVHAYQAMPAGAPKDAEKVRLEGLLDNIINIYAHAAALATGHPQYQALLQQVVPDLTSYYKYRHQSTEGLQQLIDKYKPQP
jgi:tetratricopeptide (TPR) repeat protein